jgi:hypothetical protein
MASVFDDLDDLTDDEERDLFEEFLRDALEEFPDRILINGQLFRRSGGGMFTTVEDPDDDRIFEIDPETGELFQWPDCD